MEKNKTTNWKWVAGVSGVKSCSPVTKTAAATSKVYKRGHQRGRYCKQERRPVFSTDFTVELRKHARDRFTLTSTELEAKRKFPITVSHYAKDLKVAN